MNGHFVNRNDVVQTIIAFSPEDSEWFRQKFRPNLAFMEIEIVEGGEEKDRECRLLSQHGNRYRTCGIMNVLSMLCIETTSSLDLYP